MERHAHEGQNASLFITTSCSTASRILVAAVEETAGRRVVWVSETYVLQSVQSQNCGKSGFCCYPLEK